MSRLVKWLLFRYVRAKSHFYLPLFYTYRVKKLNHSHIIKQVLAGQWGALVIAIGFSAPPYVLNACFLLLLNFSCAVIYEIGYWENDVIGEKYEARPTLSRTYAQYKDELNLQTAAPWYWAISITLFAFVLQSVSQLDAATSAIETLLRIWPLVLGNAGIWLSYLVAIRITFSIYNRLNERSRIWVYPILQAQRLFGFALVLPLNTVGAILLLSLVVSRWMNYTVYRCGGDRQLIAFQLLCLCMFTISFLALVIGSSAPATFVTWQSAIAFMYLAIRGLREASRLGISLDLLNP